jgi:hypothetical protein
LTSPSDRSSSWCCATRVPQAFSHLALVEAAARIIVAEGLAEAAR